MLRLLGQEAAKRLDEKLMGELGFAAEQLIELAGLSVAQAIFQEYAPCKTLVICGPGNNGADGLVAARHLFHFGFNPSILYPRETNNALYLKLMQQARVLGIDILPELTDYSQFALIVDAVFGFSFNGAIRPPFDTVINAVKSLPTDIVSVDIPSGWHVENGNVDGQGLDPKMLVSLTAPKLCAQHFTGTHYVGGRFVPPQLQQEFNFDLPTYEGLSQVVKLA